MIHFVANRTLSLSFSLTTAAFKLNDVCVSTTTSFITLLLPPITAVNINSHNSKNLRI